MSPRTCELGHCLPQSQPFHFILITKRSKKSVNTLQVQLSHFKINPVTDFSENKSNWPGFKSSASTMFPTVTLINFLENLCGSQNISQMIFITVAQHHYITIHNRQVTLAPCFALKRLYLSWPFPFHRIYPTFKSLNIFSI